MYSSKDFYNRFATVYGKYSARRKEYIASVNRFIETRAVYKKKLALMDVGCGDGRRANKLYYMIQAGSLTLMDDSAEMLRLSRKISGTKVVEADISDPSFKASEKYDVVLCLWNVLGHIPTAEKRRHTLRNLKHLLVEKGQLFIDVNNRYNASHYGVINVVKNIFKDVLSTPGSGDFEFGVETSSGTIQTSVHVFSPFEIEALFKTCGLRIKKRIILSYRSGKKVGGIFFGQLVYELVKI